MSPLNLLLLICRHLSFVPGGLFPEQHNVVNMVALHQPIMGEVAPRRIRVIRIPRTRYGTITDQRELATIDRVAAIVTAKEYTIATGGGDEGVLRVYNDVGNMKGRHCVGGC